MIADSAIHVAGELPRTRASDICRETGELLAVTVSSIPQCS